MYRHLFECPDKSSQASLFTSPLKHIQAV